MIDIVDVEFLAQGRFAFVYVSSWHEDLAAGLDGDPPDGVTRTASTTVGIDAVDPTPNATLFYLGPNSVAASRIDAGLVGVALEYFDGIADADEVLRRVRPEYRRFFER